MIARTIRSAGTLANAWTCADDPSASVTATLFQTNEWVEAWKSQGALSHRGSRGMPNWFLNKAARYFDQPTATADDPIAYSSTRSQPMIHATSSPSVA